MDTDEVNHHLVHLKGSLGQVGRLSVIVRDLGPTEHQFKLGKSRYPNQGFEFLFEARPSRESHRVEVEDSGVVVDESSIVHVIQ